MKVNLCGKRTVTKNGIQYVIFFFTYEQSGTEGVGAGSACVPAEKAAKMLANETNIRRGYNPVTHREYLYLAKS